MEVKVNIINEMKKIRNSIYSDSLAWVDEIIQNSQRAKAGRINVITRYNEITECSEIIITDDGCGCKNPQALFEKSTSDWDSITMASESPFGEGFFSTITMADTIIVESIGFKATFDVKKMFEENDTNAITIESSEKKSGFKVTLRNLRNPSYGLRDRVIQIGKYIESPKIYFNHERIPYEGLQPAIANEYTHFIDNNICVGWIEPYDYHKHWNCDSNGIKLFYHSRYVKSIGGFMTPVSGVVNLKDNALNLRSPDRKDVIYDEKYKTFKDMIDTETKNMFLNMIAIGDNDVLNYYTRSLENYLTVDDYEPIVRFQIEMNDTSSETTDSNNVSNNKKPTNNISVNELDDTINTSDVIDTKQSHKYYDENGCVHLDKDGHMVIQNDIDDEDCDVYYNYDDNRDDECVDETDEYNDENDDIGINDNNTNVDEEYNENDFDLYQNHNEINHESSSSEEKLDNLPFAVYIATNDYYNYETELELVKKYKFPIIRLRNKLELNVVESKNNMIPLNEIDKFIETTVQVDNEELIAEHEHRIYKLLNTISKTIYRDSSCFSIADIHCQKIITVDKKSYVIDQMEQDSIHCGNKIYVSHNHISDYINMKDTDSKINSDDRNFIFNNIKWIAKNLAMTINPSLTENSEKHMELSIEIIQKILKQFCIVD